MENDLGLPALLSPTQPGHIHRQGSSWFKALELLGASTVVPSGGPPPRLPSQLFPTRMKLIGSMSSDQSFRQQLYGQQENKHSLFVRHIKWALIPVMPCPVPTHCLPELAGPSQERSCPNTGTSWAPHDTHLCMLLRTCSKERCPLKQKVGLTSSCTFQITCPLCSTPVRVVRAPVPDVLRTAASWTELASPRVGKGARGMTCHMRFRFSHSCKALLPALSPIPSPSLVTPALVVDRVPGISSGGRSAYLDTIQAGTTLNLFLQPLTHCPHPVVYVLAACRIACG